MASLGPTDPVRAAAAEALLPRAKAAAREAGVARLAELTRLDRLGLPVWQAVRPMSRALSVHQGKGVSDADAQLGALLEAVESHLSESFDREGPVCSLDELPEGERASSLTDFARSRDAPPGDEPRRWVEAQNLLTGGKLYLPFDVVSLDLTKGLPTPLDRTSNGVAAGATLDEAVRVALHELVERDAVVEWSSRGLIACTADTLLLDSIPFGWLKMWRERLDASGIALRFYAVPSVSLSPVFVCELNDLGKTGTPYRAIHGQGCHPVPEVALFKSLAEALQVRVTYIAGAREDIAPSAYSNGSGVIVVAFGLPLPPSMPGVRWDGIKPGPETAAALLEALAEAGFRHAAMVELGQPQGISVVRAFVCGLGSIERRRRLPQ